MSAPEERRFETPRIKAMIVNRKVANHVAISVAQYGVNDYRTVVNGFGEHSSHALFQPALTKAHWLAALEQEDLNWELAKIQAANGGAS